MTSPRLAAIAAPLVADRIRSALWDASPRQYQAGLDWYPRAWDWCTQEATHSGRDPYHLAACIAALSPLQSWDKNLAMARTLARARRYRNPGTLPRFARDGWRALQGDPSATSGPKRDAFARAIAGDTTAVTVDRHILTLVGHHRDRLSPAQYRHYAGVLAEVAHEAGLAPRDAQAIVWTVERDRKHPNTNGGD